MLVDEEQEEVNEWSTHFSQTVFLTFHSNPPTASPPAAPVPARPMNKPLPTLLDIREAPIWKQIHNKSLHLLYQKVEFVQRFRLQPLYYGVTV